MRYFLKGVFLAILNIVFLIIAINLAKYLDVNIFWAVAYGWIAGYIASAIASTIYEGATST